MTWSPGFTEMTPGPTSRDRKSTRLNSSHVEISYAVFCLTKSNSIDQQALPLFLSILTSAPPHFGPVSSVLPVALVINSIDPQALMFFLIIFFFLTIRRPPRSTPLPYTPPFG